LAQMLSILAKFTRQFLAQFSGKFCAFFNFLPRIIWGGLYRAANWYVISWYTETRNCFAVVAAVYVSQLVGVSNISLAL